VVTLVALRRYVDPAVTRPAAEAEATGPDVVGTWGERIREGIRSLADSPAILALALLSFVSSAAGWGITTYTVVFLTDGYGVGLDVANLTLTAMFLAGAVMVLVGGSLSDRFRPGPIIVATYAAVGALVTLFGSAAIPAVAALVVATAVGGIRSIAGPARSKLADAFSSRADLGQTFAIVTTSANEAVREVHDRMPVILPESREREWLTAELDVAETLLSPAPDDTLRCYPVSRAVNDPSNDRPNVIEREESEQSGLGEFV
jgi:hypothetical protein